MQPAEQLAQQFLARHPETAAETLAALPPAEAAAAMAGLETPAARAVLLRLPAFAAARCLERLPAAQAAAIFASLPRREAVDLLHGLDPQTREHVLAALPAGAARGLRIGIGRMRDSVAALMDNQVTAYPLDTSVAQLLEGLERQPADHDGQVYVTDGDGRFAGALGLRELLAAHPHSRLGSLPLTPIAVLPMSARSAGLTGHPAWLRHTGLPVVDAEGRLVGVLRRERLAEPAHPPREDSRGVLGIAQNFLEGYTASSALLLELLIKGVGRRG
ncbi:MAG: magnesium transporter MgtE N-terminal domain-containing protein [Gammaproteobacteria bacterium]